MSSGRGVEQGPKRSRSCSKMGSWGRKKGPWWACWRPIGSKVGTQSGSGSIWEGKRLILETIWERKGGPNSKKMSQKDRKLRNERSKGQKSGSTLSFDCFVDFSDRNIVKKYRKHESVKASRPLGFMVKTMNICKRRGSMKEDDRRTV